jgi:aminoglycoside phosphotransferase (APT) family kinase protein
VSIAATLEVLGARPEDVRWLSERADSLVAEVATSEGNVIVKQHRPEADRTRDAATRARHEFDVLTRLRGVMPENATVPRALQLDEARGALVIERATGAALDTMIGEGKRRAEAAEILSGPLRRTGAWLRAMQDATSSEADRRQVLEAQVALGVSDAETVYDGRMRDRVVARLRQLGGTLGSRSGPVTGHHGDFWPGNVFLDEARVQVIDFEGFRDGLPMEDVAYFLLQLELLLPRHRRHLAKLREAFVSGYGGIDDRDALQLFTLTKTLRLMARDAGARHSILVRLWIRHTLRRIVGGCLS